MTIEKFDKVTEKRVKEKKGRNKNSMEVERKFLTSYPATNSGLLTLFLHYCTAMGHTHTHTHTGE